MIMFNTSTLMHQLQQVILTSLFGAKVLRLSEETEVIALT